MPESLESRRPGGTYDRPLDHVAVGTDGVFARRQSGPLRWQALPDNFPADRRGDLHASASVRQTSRSRRLASASGKLANPSQQPGEILLWDLNTGQRLVELQAGLFNVYSGLAFTADGQRLLAATNALGEMSPSRIVAWEAPRK